MRNDEKDSRHMTIIVDAPMHHKKITVELPWDADATDMLEGFYACMVGQGFSSEGMYEVMRDYAEERMRENGTFRDEENRGKEADDNE